MTTTTDSPTTPTIAYTDRLRELAPDIDSKPVTVRELVRVAVQLSVGLGVLVWLADEYKAGRIELSAEMVEAYHRGLGGH